MAKRREDRAKGKKTVEVSECDLDEGFVIPVKSVRDFTWENIRTSLSRSRYLQALVSFVLLGAILRFYNLGFNSLWLDEATTYYQSLKPFFAIWQTMAAGDFNPPLFYWIEHVMLMAGHSEFILRFMPAVLGTLFIPLMYYVGKEFMDRNTGIVAAAAAAFSPFLIYYSQEARAYALMLFFIALALVFYFKALKTGKAREWGFFGLFAALAFWSHFYVFVFIASLVLYALVLQLKDIRDIRQNLGKVGAILASVAVFTLVALPLIIMAIQLFFKQTAATPNFGVFGFDIIYQVLLLCSGSNIFILILFAALFLIGILHLYLRDRKQSIFLVSILLLIMVATYIMSYKMPMEPRHLIFIIIPFYLGIASSWGMFCRLWDGKMVVYLLMAALIIVNVPTITELYSGYTKDDWRGVSAGMQNLTKSGDKVVLIPGYLNQPFNYYYSNATDNTIELYANTVKDLDAIKADQQNSTIFYIVTSDIYAVDPRGDEVAWLQNNTKSSGRDGGIVVFISPSP